ALRRMGATDLAGRQLRELSGGQQQRLLIAQGLAQQGDVLMLDEPVTGLDLVSREAILGVVRAERDAGTAVVMTTHDLADAGAADHVVLLAGRVIASGPPEEVLTPANLEMAYGRQAVLVGDDLVVDDPHHDHR
ncbi:MAG TPA: ATP-binding cassette domain-containing protein, partial [Euzebya sp.]|nr:ATP-binding cassette domain-containing protein [Euzebya sp.]